MKTTKIMLLTAMLLTLGACASTQVPPTNGPTVLTDSMDGTWVAHRHFKIRNSPKASAQILRDVRNGTSFQAEIRAWDEIWHEVWLRDDISGFVFGRPFERAQQAPAKYR